ncbi:hypothetical protein QJQ58_23490 [Paenibacillus dendritiformis]|uniref:hypothetical protein n=1 Tax=Paenibacillus dendritiformis TaxID=130049 RepID=UPI00248A9FD8|nr:hypothetical protein [Paenibacillus dendritiformis]WGU93470.1 hypothetical protein QJQ58_23490 [Paenibacillus dendritiformis]
MTRRQSDGGMAAASRQSPRKQPSRHRVKEGTKPPAGNYRQSDRLAYFMSASSCIL